jgi:hypothetical protein
MSGSTTRWASLGLLALVGVGVGIGIGGCVGTGGSAGTSVGADPVSVAPEPEGPAVRDGAWLAALDAAELEPGPGELSVELAGEPSRLELASLRVDLHTVGTMARYQVEHVFHNPSDAQLEGQFRFPLPSGAIVTGLAMDVNGQLMDGEIVERSRAREIYEEIVDSMKDPALLEWEAGQTFSLRVFPIAPGERKRVILRYLAPLLVDPAAPSGFAATVPSAVPAMQTHIAAVTVTVDGREALAVRDHDARSNLRVPLAAATTPALVEERDGEHRYLAARVELDWTTVPRPNPRESGRRVVILVDSSRSALESWALAQEAVAALLDGLGPHDEVAVIAADLAARRVSAGFVTAADNKSAILASLAAIEPDGASDLGVALAEVGALLVEGRGHHDDRIEQVIYVGDGTATWGTTETEALVAAAREQLGPAGLARATGVERATSSPGLFGISVGARESRETLEALSGATGGRTARPETPAQLHAFAEFLAAAPHARRLVEVEVEVEGGEGIDRVHAPIRTTWYEGERPTVHLRIPADAPLPSALVVRGIALGEAFVTTIPLGEAIPVVGVREQWAARELVATTDKLAAVALSVEHSVLSRHTALLVLDSEEAYQRYQIERRNNRDPSDQDGAPEVSGRDLDGSEAAPYLGPGDLQPGDPEIFIPAPRDAISVEVVFPFGESKAAAWDPSVGQWGCRFLVDDDVEPGTYAVRVRITHADGRIEFIELEYTIDVVAPELELELRPLGDGAFTVFARQRLTDADAARERPEGRAAPAGTPARKAKTLDARRVELIMPDGQTLHLRAGTAGQFERRWVPREAVAWPATVTAVIGDRALNYRRVELVLAGPEAQR